MMIIQGIVDGKGFEVVERLAWDVTLSREDGRCSSGSKGWGFLICRAPDSAATTRYGIIGIAPSDHIEDSCLAVLLPDGTESGHTLTLFALACGLSIIDNAGVELGDTLVVAGANPLAFSVLAAGRAQGARTALLAVTNAEKTAKTYDEELDAFIRASNGKTVFVDAAGEPTLVHGMAVRLARFGRLVFCRQDVTSSVVLNIRDYHHRRSAQFIYWARPATLGHALLLQRCCQRAARLLQYGRVVALADAWTGNENIALQTQPVRGGRNAHPGDH